MESRSTRFVRAVPLAALVAIGLLVGDRAAVAASSLSELVAEYDEAKRERVAGRSRGGRGNRGRGGGGGGGRRGRGQDSTSIESILEKIARLGTTRSLGFLHREYRDPDSYIASLSAIAILKSEHDGATKIVVRGFGRGGRWTPGAKARVLDALAQAKGKEGLEFVIKLAASRNVEDRMIALASLALRPENDEVRRVLLKAAENRSPNVRGAALRALKPVRSKTVIGVLIDRLGREKEESLRTDVLRLLVGLTDQNLGFVAADWQKWWQFAEPEFVFDEKPSTKTVVVTPDLQYFGIEVASKRVCFLVDASLSMDAGANGGGRPGRRAGGGGRGGRRGGGGGPGGAGGLGGGEAKIDRMKDELARILGELPPETYVNVVPFHRNPFPWKKELHSLKGRGRDEAIKFVRGLTTGFGTNIFDTLELALGDRRVDTIFLLSDGQPVGGKYSEPQDILREIGAINRIRGAKIHTVGFGRESRFLKDLAAANGGEYRSGDR